MRYFLAAVAILRLSALADAPGWQTHPLPFRPLGITSAGHSIWVCGTDEGIAVSANDGRDWKVVRHQAKGPLLLDIGFAGEKFGYAAGSNGLLLLSQDGGSTWAEGRSTGETILQAAMADPEHGLIRTPSGVLFTADGGARWSPVPLNELRQRFPYTFALETLDAKHMLVVLKSGPSHTFSQTLLSTVDGGETWAQSEIPDTILASFTTLSGEYWAAGKQLVDKNKNGGREVPVVLHSPDGQRWTRTKANLSVCLGQGCELCRDAGCLASNGTMADLFQPRVELREFPPNEGLTASWAATDAGICFAGSTLQCSSLTPTKRVLQGPPLPAPALRAQPVLGSTSAGSGPRCLACELDPSVLASHGYGSYELHLTFAIAPNGTVEKVDIAGAPAQEIEDRVRRGVSQWIFEPTIKDGAAQSAVATTTLRVNVQSR